MRKDLKVFSEGEALLAREDEDERQPWTERGRGAVHAARVRLGRTRLSPPVPHRAGLASPSTRRNHDAFSGNRFAVSQNVFPCGSVWCGLMIRRSVNIFGLKKRKQESRAATPPQGVESWRSRCFHVFLLLTSSSGPRLGPWGVFLHCEVMIFFPPLFNPFLV